MDDIACHQSVSQDTKSCLYKSKITIVSWRSTHPRKSAHPLLLAQCRLEHGKSQAPKPLDDKACGLVLLRYGGEKQLNDRASNLFIYDCDQPCSEKGAGKMVNSRRWPVAFLHRLIEQFTNSGFWMDPVAQVCYTTVPCMHRYQYASIEGPLTQKIKGQHSHWNHGLLEFSLDNEKHCFTFRPMRLLKLIPFYHCPFHITSPCNQFEEATCMVIFSRILLVEVTFSELSKKLSFVTDRKIVQRRCTLHVIFGM